MDKLKLFQSLKLFRRVPEEDILKLGAFLTVENYADGQTVFQEGTKGDSLYFIASGRIRIAKRLPREEAERAESPAYKDLSILAPGDCFGEMAIIESLTRSADAIALGETALLKLGRPPVLLVPDRGDLSQSRSRRLPQPHEPEQLL